MSVPRIVNDGVFTTEHQIGPDEWHTPFSHVGDQLTFEVLRRYRVQENFYKRTRRMEKISTPKGYAYMVQESDAQSIGCGLLEYTRLYSSLPAYREQGTSIVYSFQYLNTGGTDNNITEIPWPVSAIDTYEYFLNRPDPMIAPRVYEFNGAFRAVGGWGTFRVGQRVLAEDSKVSIYKGGIYERRNIYIIWPRSILSQ